QSCIIDHVGVPDPVEVTGSAEPGHTGIIAASVIAVADVQWHVQVTDKVYQDQNPFAFFGCRQGSLPEFIDHPVEGRDDVASRILLGVGRGHAVWYGYPMPVSLVIVCCFGPYFIHPSELHSVRLPVEDAGEPDAGLAGEIVFGDGAYHPVAGRSPRQRWSGRK